jgi:diadenosine tetraphosphatase ApaH/serine/threonine PP2A family protein phosphatase
VEGPVVVRKLPGSCMRVHNCSSDGVPLGFHAVGCCTEHLSPARPGWAGPFYSEDEIMAWGGASVMTEVRCS